MSTKKKKVKAEVIKHLYGYILYDQEYDSYLSEMPVFRCQPSNIITHLKDEIEDIDDDLPVNIILYDLTDMTKKKYRIDNPITIKEILD